MKARFCCQNNGLRFHGPASGRGSCDRFGNRRGPNYFSNLIVSEETFNKMRADHCVRCHAVTRGIPVSIASKFETLAETTEMLEEEDIEIDGIVTE
jgi:hypothetical protein